MKQYDVAIIGAGTSGLSARRQVAKHTDNYVVIDGGILGTTCARVGCMPSKVLIQVANDFYRKHTFGQVGILGGDQLRVDHTQVMSHVRQLRDRFVRSTMNSYHGWSDTRLLRQHAKFVDTHTLDISGELIQADKIIIATGSRPIIPAPWAEYKDYLIDTDSFFEQETLPHNMAVIGLGVIGVELGQALHRLGFNISAISQGNVIGGLSDPDMIEYVAGQFSEEMTTDYSGVQSLSEQNNQLIVHTENNEFAVDKALVAIGRKPNIDRLGLENLNLKVDQRGVPLFNKNTMQIEGSNLYFAGDANAHNPLLHEAADEGTIAGLNSVSAEPYSFKRKTFLGITFSDPNIAVVGQRYADLVKDNIDFKVGTVCFEGQGRSIVKMKEVGLLKIYGCTKTGMVLGAEMFGPSIEHIAHLVNWSIESQLTVHDMLARPYYHPVIEEGLRTALRDLAGQLTETRSIVDIALCQDHPTNRCD